jgi:hypothetical protein
MHGVRSVSPPGWCLHPGKGREKKENKNTGPRHVIDKWIEWDWRRGKAEDVSIWAFTEYGVACMARVLCHTGAYTADPSRCMALSVPTGVYIAQKRPWPQSDDPLAPALPPSISFSLSLLLSRAPSLCSCNGGSNRSANASVSSAGHLLCLR